MTEAFGASRVPETIHGSVRFPNNIDSYSLLLMKKGGAILLMSDKPNNPDKKERLDWHSGFEGGLRFSLRKYSQDIEIDREHYLSREPLRIDFIIIKKHPDVIVDNAIGRGFLGHNIIEYKNPNDDLNIDVLWKEIGYASLYKSFGDNVDEIKISDITISIFRARKPKKLLGILKKDNKEVSKESPGVYLIKGLLEFPVRIIVINEIEDKELIALSVILQNANEDKVRCFIREASRLTEPGDRRNADAVLQISAKVNGELYNRLRGDDYMCEALRELMADDLKEAENIGIEKGIEKGIAEGAKERDALKLENERLRREIEQLKAVNAN